jgi:hypothetical protein
VVTIFIWGCIWGLYIVIWGLRGLFGVVVVLLGYCVYKFLFEGIRHIREFNIYKVYVYGIVCARNCVIFCVSVKCSSIPPTECV